MGKKGKKNFVIFRNCKNKKLTSLEELKEEFEDASFLKNTEFKSAFSNDIVSNKVGANKVARRAANAWIAEISGEKISIKGNSKVEEIPVTEKTAPFETKAVEDEATVEKVAALVEEDDVEDVAPIEQDVAPVALEPKVVKEDAVVEVESAVDEVTPVEEESAPVEEESAPVQEGTPVAEAVETNAVEEEIEVTDVSPV